MIVQNREFPKKLDGNRLFKITNDEGRVYYFTTLVNIAKFVGTSYAAIDYSIIYGKRIVKEWDLSIVDDGGDIPYKMINNTVLTDYYKH